MSKKYLWSEVQELVTPDKLRGEVFISSHWSFACLGLHSWPAVQSTSIVLITTPVWMGGLCIRFHIYRGRPCKVYCSLNLQAHNGFTQFVPWDQPWANSTCYRKCKSWLSQTNVEAFMSNQWSTVASLGLYFWPNITTPVWISGIWIRFYIHWETFNVYSILTLQACNCLVSTCLDISHEQTVRLIKSARAGYSRQLLRDLWAAINLQPKNQLTGCTKRIRSWCVFRADADEVSWESLLCIVFLQNECNGGLDH